MSYTSGMLNGMAQSDSIHAIVRTRADREANDSIASWQNYSSQLKTMLEQTQQKLAESEARTVASVAAWTGDAVVAMEYRTALAKADPRNPLLVKGALKETAASAAAKYANEHGYTYNPETGGVRRQG